MSLHPALFSSSYQGTISESRSLFRIIAAFLISFALVTVLTSRHVVVYDEGLILTGAMRVASGAIPHRDFYANYGPGQFYALSGLFDVFGQTVLVERLYDAVVKAGIACLVYAISLGLMRGLFAILVTAVCVLWLGSLGYPGYPLWPSLFFILLSVLPLFAIFDRSHSGFRLILSGFCAGVVVLFRYDMGALAVFALSFSLALFGLVKSGGWRWVTFRGIAALLIPFWCGAALVILPLFAAYAFNGVINDFVFQIIQFPAANYAQMRSLPFPPIWRTGKAIVYFWRNGNAIVYLPPLAIIAYIAIAITEYRQGDVSDKYKAANWTAFVIATLVIGLYFKGVVRVMPLHMAASILPSLILIGFAGERFMRGGRFRTRPALAVLLLAAVVCTAAPSVYAIRASRSMVLDNLSDAGRLVRRSLKHGEPSISTGPCDLTADLSRLRCFYASDTEKQAVDFVLSNTAPDETIFVVDGKNDKTVANDNALYFLTGRQPASKWYHFDPGLQSTQAIQDQIINDLEKRKPPLIVIDTEFDSQEEPNDSAKHSGVTNLDDYIDGRYKGVAEMGSYEILRRRTQ